MKNLKKIMFAFSLLLVSGAFAESLPGKVATDLTNAAKKEVEAKIQEEAMIINKETSRTWGRWLLDTFGDSAEKIAYGIDYLTGQAKKGISPEAAKKEAEEKKKNK
ncbi:MAG: hypothetical protein EBU90_21145 [Proteobacteria bacterium]|nr:hypothetical protein [Pseudomonadota bacterium]NBP15205.1 hypothetical protein [bacterium]